MDSQQVEPVEGEFMKQFGGSAAANGITGIVLLVILGLRKLCNRKSKCKTKLHTCCLDVDIRDDTVRNSPPTSKEGANIV